MTVIQGGPKPVVAILPTEALGRLEFRRKEELDAKVIPQGEAAARYTSDNERGREPPQEHRVDVEA